VSVPTRVGEDRERVCYEKVERERIMRRMRERA